MTYNEYCKKQHHTQQQQQQQHHHHHHHHHHHTTTEYIITEMSRTQNTKMAMIRLFVYEATTMTTTITTTIWNNIQLSND